jgi:hypothetical protein
MHSRFNQASVLISAMAVVVLLAAGCSNDIWNAGDLAEWVRDRAVEKGCERSSSELEDCYLDEGGKNIWHGSSLDRDNRERMDFEIDVDPVWKPSSGG